PARASQKMNGPPLASGTREMVTAERNMKRALRTGGGLVRLGPLKDGRAIFQSSDGDEDHIAIGRGVAGANQADGVRHSLLELEVRLESHFEAAAGALEGGLLRAVVVGGELLGHERLAAFPVRQDGIEHLNDRRDAADEERSTVSICGQNGNAASAMTRVLVCRTRQSSDCTCGLTMP